MNRQYLDPVFLGCYPDEMREIFGEAWPDWSDDDMRAIRQPIDFLGINYYTRKVERYHPDLLPLRTKHVPQPESLMTDTHWEVYPQALSDVLVRVHRDYAPRAIAVTENGAAFADQWDGSDHVSDPQRLHYLHEHLQALGKARAQGVPVQGYFVWSLLDNFEWAEGYSKRFGIVYVDYSTQRRIVKDSGRWYAAFIEAQRRQQTL